MGGKQVKARLAAGEPCALDVIPEEILQLIFSYIPARDLLLNCSRVCKYWQALLNDEVFWRRRCDYAQVSYPPDCPPGFRLDYRRVYVLRPFGRNLVTNWNAADGLEGWTVTSDGGDGFAVEPDNCPGSDRVSSIQQTGCVNCWATSFVWCSKHQLIDLYAVGINSDMLQHLPLTVNVSEWVTSRFDCASMYELEIELWSRDHEVLAKHKIERSWTQWENRAWEQVTHLFSPLPANTRYVYLEHSGKDSQFWKGHYGPKITGTSVLLN